MSGTSGSGTGSAQDRHAAAPAAGVDRLSRSSNSNPATTSPVAVFVSERIRRRKRKRGRTHLSAPVATLARRRCRRCRAIWARPTRRFTRSSAPICIAHRCIPARFNPPGRAIARASKTRSCASPTRISITSSWSPRASTPTRSTATASARRLPADVQEQIVRLVPGLENAKILRHGYAVEYDMVWPTQIRSTLETKKIAGLFLAGQINGTSGYEEAAAQGLIAGINAARYAAGGVDGFRPAPRSGVHRRADRRSGHQAADRAVPHVHQPRRASPASAQRQRRRAAHAGRARDRSGG